MVALPTPFDRVLVLDGEQRAALAVTRALGRRGIPVYVASAQARTISGSSRFCSGRLVHASPIDEPQKFADEVAGFIARNQITSVYPITDISTMLLAERANELMPARLCAPSAAAYFAVTDKATLVASAVRLGVPVPTTIVATSADEIVNAVARIGFPAVLKPSRSRFIHDANVLSTSVKIAASAADLKSLLTKVPWIGHVPCLVQEFVPGHGAGIFTLFGNRGPLVWFAHQRIREMPPSGGVSVVCESAAPDSQLQQYAERLLCDANWFGPAMVEFRIGPQGRPYLMEINGRFWGSLQLPIDCGVDFPWLLLCASRGEELLGPTHYATGKRLRWLLRDFDNMVVQLRDRKLGPRHKMRVMRDFAITSFDLHCRQELFRWDDMGPAFRELVTYLADLSFLKIRRGGGHQALSDIAR